MGAQRVIRKEKARLLPGHYPDVDYFDNEYLVLLTADTVNVTEFSDYTMADCAAKMAARASD